MTIELLERASDELIAFITEANPYRALLILVLAVIVSYWLSKFVARFIITVAQKVAVRSENESNSHKALRLRQVETYLGVTVAVVRVVIVAIMAYIAWRVITPEGSAALGGSGAAAIGASAVFVVIAGQTLGPLLRDITAGSIIIIEQWFTVGDYIRVEPFMNVSGVVERLTLRSTKIRALSGEVIWIHNQKMDAVHVTPTGVRTLAVSIHVNNEERGEKLIADTIAKLPTGPMTLAQKLRITDKAQWSDDLWMITVVGKTIPGREWLIEEYFVSTLKKENEKLPKAKRLLEADPIVRHADPVSERKFRRAVRINKQK